MRNPDSEKNYKETERYLKVTRDFAFDNDLMFEELYEDIIDFTVYLKKNKEKIQKFVINSHNAKIELVSCIENHYAVVWDTEYWKLFEDFLYTFISIDYNIHYKDEHVKYGYDVDKLNQAHIKYFEVKLLQHMLDKYRINLSEEHQQAIVEKEINMLLGTKTPIDMTGYEELIREKESLSKCIVLMHEFEHALSVYCPEVKERDLELMHILLEMLHEVDKMNGVNEITLGANLEMLNPTSINNQVIKDEIFGDFHAFIEFVSFYSACSGDNIDKVLSELAVSFIVDLRLLNTFRLYTTTINDIMKIIVTYNDYETKSNKIKEYFDNEHRILSFRPYIVSRLSYFYCQMRIGDDKELPFGLDDTTYMKQGIETLFTESMERLIKALPIHVE